MKSDSEAPLLELDSANSQLSNLSNTPQLMSFDRYVRGPRSRYIGSKTRVAGAILNVIGRPSSAKKRFIDLFCGAGSVSSAASRLGWSVWSNDHLFSSSVFTGAQLLDKRSAKFEATGGYQETIRLLNLAKPIHGPIFAEYSPSGNSASGDVRQYFTCANAAKIDGIRTQIGSLFSDGMISDTEHSLLLADLISAANSVANIAGTYGCFLRKWMKSAEAPLIVEARMLPKDLPHSVSSTADAFEFSDAEEDVLYCDPPYTKRQYAAYYHLLETIALGDHPKVHGVAGIREWKEKSSPFCFRRKAAKAFQDLVNSKKARTIYFSYSSEGHLPISELTESISPYGRVRLVKLSHVARYAPNETSRANARPVTEYLIELVR